MYPNLWRIQISMSLLVALGGYLLGRSLAEPSLVAICVLGAAASFMLVDRLRLMALSGWAANVVSILVLYFAMHDFVGGDSTTKLTSVARLLAYLQTSLLFQVKTTRLCWQILVLSILQTVVAAIFHLNFEFGFWFVVYFGVILSAMYFQNDFILWLRSNRCNDRSLPRVKPTPAEIDFGSGSPVTTECRAVPNSYLTSAWPMVIPWMAVSLLFSFVLFHSLPHTRQYWKSPTERQFIGTGKSHRVRLDELGPINQSSTLILRARFSDPRTGDRVIVNGSPYFRGMALSQWGVDNGVTSWFAPYDHVFESWSYDRLLRYIPPEGRQPSFKPVHTEFIIEPTSDPLLFAQMPAYYAAENDAYVEYCRDLSALTRRRSRQTSSITSFTYTVTTLLDSSNRPPNGWPYIPFSGRMRRLYPMQSGSPEQIMLTEFDRTRYPTLVEISNGISQQDPSTDRVALCQALLAHFSESNGYRYNLDLRTVNRDLKLDPVEDFVRNHRNGHCELFASALTLMLRAQGIPARYVIGFHGGEFNPLTDCYVIHGSHAHAWVEAYIAPDNFTPEMAKQGIAGEYGTWLQLDPTPPTGVGGTSSALDLARTIWQDYVISPDHNKQTFSEASKFLTQAGTQSGLTRSLEAFIQLLKKNRIYQALIISGAALFLFANQLGYRQTRKKQLQRGPGKFMALRESANRAIATLAPALARRMNIVPPCDVRFYKRLERMLKDRFGLTRAVGQTQLEFISAAGGQVLNHLPASETANEITALLQSLTSRFYHVRFGREVLDDETTRTIEIELRRLDQLFATI